MYDTVIDTDHFSAPLLDENIQDRLCLIAGFLLFGGFTVNGTHYHVDHNNNTGITWHEDRVNK